MKNEIAEPKTLQEAILFYADEMRCIEMLAASRWEGGIAVCPYCNSTPCTFMKSVKRWQCKNKACKKQFSIKVGTYMEDSPIGLDKWLTAMWLISGAKNGVSSCEIARSIGITQKSAWFLLHRIRLSFGDYQADDLSGECEADETFIGGLEKNKHEHKKLHAGRGTVGKTPVMGIVERGGKAKTKVIPDTSKATLHAEVQAIVCKGSELFTDAHAGYKGLSPEYLHAVVDHAIEYVNGRIHTNNAENFWSLLKRMLKGTYVSVDIPHLPAYLDEQTFRYNERKDNDAGRFAKTVKGVHGKRLTYEQLTNPANHYMCR